MNPSPVTTRRLGIEALETRTLLAGAADPFGLVADYDATMLAVSGTGDFAGSFSTNFGNHQLVLTGTSETSITIDLDKLPAFITNLKISGFASVNLIGTDTVQNFILADIDVVSAPNLTITGQLQATNVDRIEVGAAGDNSVLTFVGKAAELRIDTFGDGSTIFSNLQALTLSTDDDLVLFVNVPNEQYADQYLYLKDYNPGLVVDPDGILWSHIQKWTEPIVVPETPDDPTDPVTPDTPPVTPDVPHPPTDPVTPTDPGFVIVDLPLDELTRSFVLQLRALLASSSTDVDQLVAEYLAQRDSSAGPMGAAIADAADRLDGPHPTLISGVVPGTPDAGMIPGLDVPKHTSGLIAAWTLNAAFMAPSEASAAPILAAPEMNLTPSAASIGWLQPLLTATSDAGPARLENSSARNTVDEPTIAESFEALGSYIAARVSAEFTPGQQSLVLMVDPPPPRGLAGSKKAVLDRAPVPSPVVVVPGSAVGLA